MRQNVCERKSEARRGEWLIIVGIVKLTVDSLLAHFRIYNSTVRVHDFCIGGCISLCLHVHFTHLFNPSFVPYTSSPSQVVSLQLCVLDRTSHICSPAEAAQDTQKEDDTRQTTQHDGKESKEGQNEETRQAPQPHRHNLPKRTCQKEEATHPQESKSESESESRTRETEDHEKHPPIRQVQSDKHRPRRRIRPRHQRRGETPLRQDRL